MSQVRFDEIDKGKAIKNVAIACVILIIVFIIEIQYFTKIQLGIFNIAKKI
jgi:hypothetical protein